MTKTNSITESFAAGELTPLLLGRVSTEGYKQGARGILNMITDPRGAITRRFGTAFQSLVADRTEVKKSSFAQSSVEPFDVTLTDLLVSIQPDSVQRLGEETIPGGEFIKKDLGWEDSTSGSGVVVFSKGAVKFTPTVTAAHYMAIRKVITIKEQSVSHRLVLEGIFNGTLVGEGTEVRIGTTLGANDIGSYTAFGDKKFYLDDTVAVGANPRLYIEVRVHAQTSVALADVVPSWLNKISLKPLKTTIAPVTYAAPYTEAEIPEVRMHMSPNGNDMYFTHKNYIPWKLSYVGAGVFTMAAVIFTAPPSEWTTGTGNYPTTMTFFQGRSLWAGCFAHPEAWWASKSGSFEDMTIGVLAADAFKYSIAKPGLIKWIIGSKSLLIGTENAEFVVSAESGLIQPTDVNVDQQSAFGSGDIQPLELGTEVLYVSPDGKKLRTMGYSWTDSGWVTQDLTETAEHITEDPIVDMAYARNPDSVIWMVTRSGAIVTCAYRYIAGKTPVIGWQRQLLDSPVKAVSVMELNGSSIPWFAVLRTVAGEPQINNEKGYLKTDGYFTDGSVEVVSNSGTTAITGLGHFEGQTVYPLVDGSVHPGVVVSSGAITLDQVAYHIIVGSHTNPKINTLPLVLYGAGAPVITGKKQWAGVNILLVDSAMPLVEGTRPPDRSPSTPMGIRQPLKTGFIEVPQLGWDKGEIEIEMDLPLPLTVVAIAGETKQNVI